ncbi:hypothetical protein Tco_1422430, partial [Tanacetum coccineum]
EWELGDMNKRMKIKVSHELLTILATLVPQFQHNVKEHVKTFKKYHCRLKTLLRKGDEALLHLLGTDDLVDLYVIVRKAVVFLRMEDDSLILVAGRLGGAVVGAIAWARLRWWL